MKLLNACGFSSLLSGNSTTYVIRRVSRAEGAEWFVSPPKRQKKITEHLLSVVVSIVAKCLPDAITSCRNYNHYPSTILTSVLLDTGAV